ncbi:hypothetical protein GQ457_06G013970 [Hibiscus cannabinus]
MQDDDLKKPYRKLTVKWHPDKNHKDKNETEVKFKQIFEAYEAMILKSEYSKEGLKDIPPLDSRGPSFGKGNGERNGFNPRNAEAIFVEFFFEVILSDSSCPELVGLVDSTLAEGSLEGLILHESEILAIDVKPEWKKGTKKTFLDKGKMLVAST